MFCGYLLKLIKSGKFKKKRLTELMSKYRKNCQKTVAISEK